MDGPYEELLNFDTDEATYNDSVFLPTCCDFNDTYSYVPYSERPETYIVPVVFAIIFLVGVLGNGTLVFIFARHKTMRNIPNTYIFSLALGDLLVIVSCVPFTSILYTLESWPWGEVICKLSEATKDVSIGVSVFTLTALSAERYCAIVNPIQRHLSSKPFTIVTVLAIWFLSLLLAVPSAVFSNVQTATLHDNRTIQFCWPFPIEYGQTYEKIIVLLKFFAYYAIPLKVIGCFYILMARHLVLSTKRLPGQHGKCQTNQIQARKKVAKMVLAFVIIFIVCFFPYHTFQLWFHFYPDSQEVYDNYWHTFRIVGFCLSYLNSCINPIALYFISNAFRKHFNRYLFCCVSSKVNVPEETMVRMNSASYRRHNSVVTSQYSISQSDKA